MLSLGGLTFAVPWALAALGSLPVIWWLLRIAPPAPRRIGFPAVRLLLGLRQVEETPAHTPPWLLILRLVIAALVIVAVAHPLLNASVVSPHKGPLVVVIDDGWGAAAQWDRRTAVGKSLIETARIEGRGVLVAATAPAAGLAGGDTYLTGTLTTADDALAMLQAMEPKPWPVDRAGFAAAFEFAWVASADAEAVWLSDGLADGDPAATERFIAALEAVGPLSVYVDPPADRAAALLPPTAAADGLTLRLVRSAAGEPETVLVRAAAADGRVLARQTVRFDTGALEASERLDLPQEMRNELARLTIEGETNAAATVLMDERWRRRPVGLISGSGFESSQPLLSDLYYLERALSPFGEVRRGDTSTLIDSGLAVLALADVGELTGDAVARLGRWIEAGGVLVRFAGVRVAEGVDALVPVRLRSGGRALGGALTWEQPQRLMEFPDASPFAGLPVPDDVLVERQVLAEPALDLDEKTWARLADGTPLVTAEPRGRGWLILFHTTANTEWSSLALSGLFVEMMQRLATLSTGVAEGSAVRSLPPLSSLDGFGRLGGPVPHAAPIPARDFVTIRPGPLHPPGEYGDAAHRRALNLGSEDLVVAAFDGFPGTAAVRDYAASILRDLRPWLLALALGLAVVDTLIGLWLRGLMPRIPQRAATLLAAMLVAGAAAKDAMAQTPADADIVAMTQETRFGYVRTGDPETDRISAEGLAGLSSVLRARTAIEAGVPVAVDPAVDELAFFPLLYWPATANQRPLDDATVARIDSYLRHGGMILFDTRDRSPLRQGAGDTAGGSRLRVLLRGLNIPPLRPVPRDHALTRAFYLIDRFPGRWAGGDIWVERYEGDVNDGVSSIVVGGNDYAAAWARDADGFPLYPVIPGTDRQREWALRFGVNLAMYALTGNYKADQVHIPAILRRLGESGPILTE